MGIIPIHWSFPALLTFQKRYFIIFNHQSLEHRNCLFERKTNQHKATSFPNAYISAKKQNKTCHYVRNVPFLRCLFLRYLKTHRPLSANSQIMEHHRHAAFQLTFDSKHEHTNIHNLLTALPYPTPRFLQASVRIRPNIFTLNRCRQTPDFIIIPSLPKGLVFHPIVHNLPEHFRSSQG